MKKERTLAGIILTELAVGAAEILIVLAAILGFLFVIGFVAELCDGLISAGTAVFVLSVAAGLILYIDFRPVSVKKNAGKRACVRNRAVNTGRRKAIGAYSAR